VSYQLFNNGSGTSYLVGAPRGYSMPYIGVIKLDGKFWYATLCIEDAPKQLSVKFDTLRSAADELYRIAKDDKNKWLKDPINSLNT
jgi:hypothetical protein